MQHSNEEEKKLYIKHAKDKQGEELYTGNDLDHVAELSKLKLENENYQQEVYGLRQTLMVTKATVRHLQEENEIIKERQDLALRDKDAALLDANTKYHVARENYTQRIVLLEAKLNQETEERKRLQNLLQQYKEERNAQNVQTNLDSTSKNHLSFELLFCYIIIFIFLLFFVLQEEKDKCEQAEGLIVQLKNECKEFQRVIMVTKEQLADKTKALEVFRAELHVAHSKIVSAKQNPTNDSTKGNSLFCEVEDRRLDAMVKLNTLRKKYEELKNLYKAGVIEMKALKIERAEMLRKWECNTVVIQRGDFELISKYKMRIVDLENKLKAERHREMELRKHTSSDISFNHIELIINELKRERQELRLNIEDLSKQLLILEEVKSNLNDQIQNWRHKTTTLELQLGVLKTELVYNKFTYANQYASPEALRGNDEPNLISEKAEISEVPNEISNPLSSSTQQFLHSLPNSLDARQAAPMSEILVHDEKSDEPIKSTKRVTMDNHSADHSHELESKKVVRSIDNTTINEMEKRKAKKQGKHRVYPAIYIDC